MNIYRISQDTNSGYDTYDSAIVIASNEEEARNIHPNGIVDYMNQDKDWYHFTWTEPHNVKVELISHIVGEYYFVNGTVLCASFNAG